MIVMDNETKQLWIGARAHRALKIAAAHRGTTMRALVEAAIQAYLDKEADDEDPKEAAPG